MNVGLYFDVRNPSYARRPWPRVYDFALSVCEVADDVGLHSVWVTEHHGFEDGYMPQPLTFAAAIAARTRRVRIGTALLIAPLRSAAQIAEDAAVVDILSHGRLELGLGPGYREPEFDLFGADHAARHRTTADRVEEIRRLWRDGTVTPPPVQEEVPIWLGYRRPIGARRAGRLGAGVLAIEPQVETAYREGLAEAGLPPDRARMAGPVHGYVTEDPERDWPEVAGHLSYWADAYRQAMVAPGDPPPKPIDPERWRARGIVAGLGGFAFGTPEEVAAAIRAYVGRAPVETVFFEAVLGGMPEELVLRQVHALARLGELLRG